MDTLDDEVVRDLGAAAATVGTRALLVGAQAVGRIAPLPRRTGDADFAVLLDSWDHLERFLDASRVAFEGIDRVDLKLVHRATQTRVDLLPCGPIEAPPGRLEVRDSDRVFNNTGVAEAFDHSVPYGPDLPAVLVPRAFVLVVLKLFAWSDRRAVKDLRDLGHLLRHAPRVDDRMYDHDAFMAGLERGDLDYEDWRAWQVGVDVAGAFTPLTCEAVRGVLRSLRSRPEIVRVGLVPVPTERAGEDRAAAADRLLGCLASGLG